MLAKDAVYAARSLRKNPAFTLTALITIALGIGASTAIFSVVNAVLLRPLPYADAERLVLVGGDMRNRSVFDFPFPPGDFADLRAQTTAFEGLTAVNTFPQSISGDQAQAQPERVIVGGVTTNFFGLLGAKIAAGRDFVEEDGAPPPPPPPAGAAQPANPPPQIPAIAILSHEFWQRRYGSDPNIIGRNIDLGGGRAQVVGVAAPGFELLFP